MIGIPRGRSAYLAATAFAQTLLAAASAAASRTILGVPGTPHGASDHSDITRSRWLWPETATLQGTTESFITVGSSPNAMRAVNLPDNVISGCIWSLEVPDDWTSGVLTAQVFWAPSASDATPHAVRWAQDSKEKGAGVDITAAATSAGFTGASAAYTANICVADTATSIGITPSAPGVPLTYALRRNGTNGADTYVGDVRVVAVRITYTANQ